MTILGQATRVDGVCCSVCDARFLALSWCLLFHAHACFVLFFCCFYLSSACLSVCLSVLCLLNLVMLHSSVQSYPRRLPLPAIGLSSLPCLFSVLGVAYSLITFRLLGRFRCYVLLSLCYWLVLAFLLVIVCVFFLCFFFLFLLCSPSPFFFSLSLYISPFFLFLSLPFFCLRANQEC